MTKKQREAIEKNTCLNTLIDEGRLSAEEIVITMSRGVNLKFVKGIMEKRTREAAELKELLQCAVISA